VGIFEATPTKSALKKALKKGHITINDEPAKTGTWITGGERLHISIPEKASPKKAFNFPLKILYEDDHLAVIHKPAGIAVSGNSFKNVGNALSLNLKISPLADATSPHPVHRLDHATTGALLVGKTRSSIRALNKAFENKEIAKIYYAAAIGKMEPNGEISHQIDNKESLSSFSVCNTVDSVRFDKLNLVKLEPKTGRRHQLRIHLSSIGNPILGDKDYGTEGLVLMGKGMYLHAFSLQFTHPFSKEQILVDDPLPTKFQKLFEPRN